MPLTRPDLTGLRAVIVNSAKEGALCDGTVVTIAALMSDGYYNIYTLPDESGYVAWFVHIDCLAPHPEVLELLCH
jgi:hypothetical protein